MNDILKNLKKNRIYLQKIFDNKKNINDYKDHPNHTANSFKSISLYRLFELYNIHSNQHNILLQGDPNQNNENYQLHNQQLQEQQNKLIQEYQQYNPQQQLQLQQQQLQLQQQQLQLQQRQQQIQEYFKPYIQFQSNIEKIKGHILIKIYSLANIMFELNYCDLLTVDIQKNNLGDNINELCESFLNTITSTQLIRLYQHPKLIPFIYEFLTCNISIMINNIQKTDGLSFLLNRNKLRESDYEFDYNYFEEIKQKLSNIYKNLNDINKIYQILEIDENTGKGKLKDNSNLSPEDKSIANGFINLLVDTLLELRGIMEKKPINNDDLIKIKEILDQSHNISYSFNKARAFIT